MPCLHEQIQDDAYDEQREREMRSVSSLLIRKKQESEAKNAESCLHKSSNPRCSLKIVSRKTAGGEQNGR